MVKLSSVPQTVLRVVLTGKHNKWPVMQVNTNILRTIPLLMETFDRKENDKLKRAKRTGHMDFNGSS